MSIKIDALKVNIKKDLFPYKGKVYIDVRSHICRKAVNFGYNIIVTGDKFDGKMILTPKDLCDKSKLREICKKEFTSNFSDKGKEPIKYKLISYPWTPDQ